MRLPNREHAIVGIRKLRDYCLNPDNPRGSNKAHIFAAMRGLTAIEAEQLSTALLHAARRGNAVLGELDRHGQRYTIDFMMTTETGRAQIRSGWIVLHSEQRRR